MKGLWRRDMLCLDVLFCGCWLLGYEGEGGKLFGILIRWILVFERMIICLRWISLTVASGNHTQGGDLGACRVLFFPPSLLRISSLSRQCMV